MAISRSRLIQRASPDHALALAPVDERSLRPECEVRASRLALATAANGACTCCPAEAGVQSCRTTWSRDLSSAELVFLVSRDEEYVRLHLLFGRLAYDLGDRGHNYLLLTLARLRLADASASIPVTARGWLDPADVAHDPSMAPPKLNIDVFRIRRQFASVGLPDGSSVIERRARTRQLRLGTERVSIRRI